MFKDMKKKCGECGMIVFQNEYHPYAACILYKQTRQAEKVQDLLRDIASYGYQAAENGVALKDALRNIAASDVVAGEIEIPERLLEPAEHLINGIELKWNGLDWQFTTLDKDPVIICSGCGYPIIPDVGCPHSIAGVTATKWQEMSPAERRDAIARLPVDKPASYLELLVSLSFWWRKIN